MADQAWRDRCARAMGWVPNKSKNPSQDARYWADSDGDWVEPMSSWAPDEDYDQAMMMRDECARRQLEIQFLNALYAETAHFADNHPQTTWAMGRIAFATAEQIASAALMTLEDARA